MEKDDEPSQVRQAVLAFEAVKLKLSQDKSGYILTLSVHPQDVPDALVRAWVGTRFQCALVQLDDEDQPVIPEAVKAGELAVKQSGMLCRNPKFQRWMHDQGYALAPSEESCVVGLYETLKIKSRSELRVNETARNLFQKLTEGFSNHLRGHTERD
jgi:hypothetical protein